MLASKANGRLASRGICRIMKHLINLQRSAPDPLIQWYLYSNLTAIIHPILFYKWIAHWVANIAISYAIYFRKFYLFTHHYEFVTSFFAILYEFHYVKRLFINTRFVITDIFYYKSESSQVFTFLSLCLYKQQVINYSF